MVKAPYKSLTLAEFLKLPEIKPANQYIDGKIIHKPCCKGNTVQFKANLSLLPYHYLSLSYQ